MVGDEVYQVCTKDVPYCDNFYILIIMLQRRSMKGPVFILMLLVIFISCQQPPHFGYVPKKSATGNKAMVTTAHPLATATGLRILKAGGNAVDAAIAVQFALAVVYPIAGNIGGGGFMMIDTPHGAPCCLDFRECAPGAAHRDMYLDSVGNNLPEASVLGHLAVGVPGVVDGMVAAHKRFGSLPWSVLMVDAIDYARNGFVLTALAAAELNENQPEFDKHNSWITPFQNEINWKAGDTLVQTDLANTLTYIRDFGRAGFYGGPVASMITKEMTAHGGLITAEDLNQYTSVWREPLRGWYRDYEILTMPPPSSGGVALLQLLEMIEDELPGNFYLDPEHMHRMIEAERRVFADRSVYLGDPDFVTVPVQSLLDSLYIQSRMATFQQDTMTPSHFIQGGLDTKSESEETTHFSIMDDKGFSVAVTTTINLEFGSKVAVEGAGFLLNNEMDDFSAKPGVPNSFGLIGGEQNAIAPRKRMLSSMTPTIVKHKSHPILVVGSPGGSTIITTVFQIITDVLDYELTIDQAVQAPRFHHQWLPDTVWVEEGIPELTRKQLKTKGHKVVQRRSIGRVDAIWVDKKGLIHGAADPRGDDEVEGY
jgi:gamma-glutamyltranspeptidase/glutathione hydrolase